MSPFINRFTEFVKSLLPRKYEVDSFLDDFFSQPEDKKIIQVGANDGVMSDPLRPFLTSPGNYRAILVEPIPFYVAKLQKLYTERKDIRIIQGALGSENKIGTLYFIPPHVADLMNGEGPQNNWAHGQGSFDRNIVVHWIEQNKFRGDKYCQQVPYFISSIDHIDIPIHQVKELISPSDQNLLLVVDVQGFELEVLKGIDWDYPPEFIMIEDDLDNPNNVIGYLESKGYRYVCGTSDKIFSYGKLRKF